MSKNKIKSLNNIVTELSQLSKTKVVIHCHGVFDLLHIGHIKYFQEAKSMGDVLIVTITPDHYVKKGSGRPAFSENHRTEVIAALDAVDYVAINEWPTAIETIKLLKPNIYVKGPDYKDNDQDITGNIQLEVNAIKSLGGEIRYTSDISFSSSSLLNNYGTVFNESQKSFIKKLLKVWNFDEIKKIVDKLQNLKVLVIGETIVDQYIFCEALGKSGKEPVLVLRDLKQEQYAGGAAAIARHLAEFCGTITLLSVLGEKMEYKDFVLDSLQNNIKPYFIYKENSPTITKKRYVDHITNNKTLGVYSINDTQMSVKNQNQLNEYIKELIPMNDMVIVSDYGHGFISEEIAKQISKQSVFFSLNAQINAANIGYHTMNNYRDIDCAIINESELRHELRDRESNIETLMKQLAVTLQIKNLVVTQGDSGVTLFNLGKNTFYQCPAFAGKVVDKIGSGDAMLALISCALKRDFDADLSLFIGSLAAAQSVESIGNSSAVNKIQLIKTFMYAIK
jgi:rfaE bifunctional protein kinase chain/domain/rfaE bifunctional protein nucleotidyltransferase chain/domain